MTKNTANQFQHGQRAKNSFQQQILQSSLQLQHSLQQSLQRKQQETLKANPFSEVDTRDVRNVDTSDACELRDVDVQIVDTGKTTSNGNHGVEDISSKERF